MASTRPGLRVNAVTVCPRRGCTSSETVSYMSVDNIPVSRLFLDLLSKGSLVPRLSAGPAFFARSILLRAKKKLDREPGNEANQRAE